MVPGHMKGLGQLVAVFSVDDIGLSHQRNLWEPWEGHCPREEAQGKSYLGLFISGIDFLPKLSLQSLTLSCAQNGKIFLSIPKIKIN